MRIERLGKRAVFIFPSERLKTPFRWVISNLHYFMEEAFPNYAMSTVEDRRFRDLNWGPVERNGHELIEFRFTIKEADRSLKEPKLHEVLAKLCLDLEMDFVYLEVGDEAVLVCP